MKPIILPFGGNTPKIHESVFIAPGSSVAGDVEIGAGTSLWFQVGMRGDVNYIRIGENTNIQDGTICHVTTKKFPLFIGSNVTVGHSAILHGCTLEDGAFVGMGATVMDGATVQAGAMVAAGALLTPGKIAKTGEIWAGNPAKFMREMTQEEKDYLPWSAQHYFKLGQQYKQEIEA